MKLKVDSNVTDSLFLVLERGLILKPEGWIAEHF